jgi:single-strand DNA-binding protein
MILTGLCRLGADADVRYLQDGTAVANLSIAYNYGKKDSEGKRPTQWIKASLWGVRAENSAPYLVKGTLLSVVLDDVCIETYDRKDGGTGTNLKARVNNFEFAGGKPKESQAPAEPQHGSTRTPAKQTGGDIKDMPDDKPWENDDPPF